MKKFDLIIIGNGATRFAASIKADEAGRITPKIVPQWKDQTAVQAKARQLGKKLASALQK